MKTRIACFVIITVVLFSLLPLSITAAQDANQAGLVIDYGDGTVETLCVTFTEPAISGLTLLDRSGIPYTQEDSFVTSIHDVNCGGDPDCTFFWSYWYQDEEGAWQAYNVGAADAEIVDGSVDGWRWADWEAGAAPPPEETPSLDSICAQAQTVTGETPSENTGMQTWVPYLSFGLLLVALVAGYLIFGRARA
ncbi:MAG: hypothetical protein ACP5GX_01105 [Anaerolineae bacterium]